MEIHEVLSDPNRFIKWLRKKNSHAVVGEKFSFARCPLAYYLQEATKVTRVIVSNHCYHTEYETDSLPEWARQFVKLVDRNGDYRITAYDALIIMMNVTEKESEAL